MKKIMFNDKYGLTKAVIEGRKTITRRIIKGEIPLGNWAETEKYSPYKVGEIVAIAQAYRDIYNHAYHIGLHGRTAGWDNKMFVRAYDMPHHIKITNIRVEHLQDISDEDCLRDGIYAKKLEYIPSGYNPNRTYYTFDGVDYCFNDARYAFEELIDKVSGRCTWQSNPLVWVYEFELVD